MSSSSTHRRSISSPAPHHHRRTPLHHHSLPPQPSPLSVSSSKPNLTTTLYYTHIGVFAVTWSRTLFGGRSLYIYLLHSTTTAADDDVTTTSTSTSTSFFHLQIKPFIFWNKYGSKKIQIPITNQNDVVVVQIHYDFTRAKFGTSPEPISGFYITAIVSGQIALLIGDSVPKQAIKSTNSDKTQITILRREHVYGIANKKYITKATFRGKTRELTIDSTRIIAGAGDDSRLCFAVDGKRVLVVKHLNWKFRGNERVEIDGVHIQISWNIYNWLFEEEIDDDRYALFVFRFEKSGFDYHEDDKYLGRLNASGFGSGLGFGFEKRKMKKEKVKTVAGSSSSSSLSSASSGCGSVMEWESVEENELKAPSGFSLLVYVWKN